MEKNYSATDIEDRIYSWWEESGFFHDEPDENKEPFCIMMPPPNITGQLHMGHALDGVLQDALTRYKRMSGFCTLWLPGTDHASIATEVKIVEKLRAEGKTKKDVGRAKFLKMAWEWKELYGSTIVKQYRKMGASCDWQRERFTLDKQCTEAVNDTFVKLYRDGLIYKGDRIINWCPDCKTALSDAEVDYETEPGHLYYVKYKVKDEEEYITVATTRPETMLGDTAIAVHPDDERYKNLVGKTVILPLMDKEIPIIADDYVEKDFGSGAVKITPAHDPNDFEVGLRHELPIIRVMDDAGKINKLGGVYNGLTREEAREQILKDLKKLGALVEIKDHEHNVGHCYRCSTIVEPIVSNQWFVKMKELAEPALQAVRDGRIVFEPKRFEKIYFNWLENIKDWCISRQLWWGHRIPAYYNNCGNYKTVENAHGGQLYCNNCNLLCELNQDEDVLDTWFSSGLWPFATLGWPKQTKDFEYFYPTSTLVTGYDIIFFWVSRMIMLGLYDTKEIPFNTVLIHGIVRDEKGRKMSKSLGNGIDPLEIIEKYGADALRFSLVQGTSPGNDMRFYNEKVEASRNFANKIWNASRFILLNINEADEPHFELEDIDIADKWILSRLSTITKEVSANLDANDMGLAVGKLYDFAWNEFCDWYIEICKPRLYSNVQKSRNVTLGVLLTVIKDIIKLLHPFMPFITEEIYSFLPESFKDSEALIIAAWPKANYSFSEEEEAMTQVMELIREIRNVRAQMNVAPSNKTNLYILPKTGQGKAYESTLIYLERLAYAKHIDILISETEIPENVVACQGTGAQAFIPLGELIDVEIELKRLSEEKEKLENEIKRCSSMLLNEGFLKKAPEHVVVEEKEKLAKYNDMLENTLKRMEMLERGI